MIQMYSSFLFLMMSPYLVNTMKIPNMRKISYINRDLAKGYKTVIIDIDNTICSTEKSNYMTSIPIYDNIEKFNSLYDKGHMINYWTARGANSGENWDIFTMRQLHFWGVKYDALYMDKPHYDIWIDDKAFNINDIDDLTI